MRKFRNYVRQNLVDTYEYVSKQQHGWQAIFQEEFYQQIEQTGQDVMKGLLENQLKLIRDEGLRVSHYERNMRRRGYSNGYYRRKLVVFPGKAFSNVVIPRCSHKQTQEQIKSYITKGFQVLTPYVIELFKRGHCIGKLSDLVEALIGVSISPTTASKLVKQMDQDVRAWHTRELSDDYKYLLFDGIHLKRKSTCSLFRECAKSEKRVVLACFGIKEDGLKELIAFRIVDKESKANWRSFMRNLYLRGLHGSKLKLITTDGHKGFAAAISEVWPMAKHQLCWFHKLGNVCKRVRKRDRRKVASDLREIYKASNLREAQHRFKSFKERWQELYPKAVHIFEKDLDRLFSVFSMPAEDRRMIRTTNIIERLFREVRKRTRPIGCFANNDSISRVVYAVFMYNNSRYKRSYKMQLSKASRKLIA